MSYNIPETWNERDDIIDKKKYYKISGVLANASQRTFCLQKKSAMVIVFNTFFFDL